MFELKKMLGDVTRAAFEDSKRPAADAKTGLECGFDEMYIMDCTSNEGPHEADQIDRFHFRFSQIHTVYEEFLKFSVFEL